MDTIPEISDPSGLRAGCERASYLLDNFKLTTLTPPSSISATYHALSRFYLYKIKTNNDNRKHISNVCNKHVTLNTIYNSEKYEWSEKQNVSIAVNCTIIIYRFCFQPWRHAAKSSTTHPTKNRKNYQSLHGYVIIEFPLSWKRLQTKRFRRDRQVTMFNYPWQYYKLIIYNKAITFLLWF